MTNDVNTDKAVVEWIASATYSKRQNSCYLHGMFPKEVVNGSDWLKKTDRRLFHSGMTIIDVEPFLLVFLVLSILL